MSDAEPRVDYVCLVCFAASSTAAGVCARDGVPLAPLTEPDVLAALRARVERRSRRRESVRFGVALAAGAAIAWPLCVAFGWQLAPRAAEGLYSSTFVWVALLAAITLGGLSLAIVRPLPTQGDAARLLAQLGLDRPRER